MTRPLLVVDDDTDLREALEEVAKQPAQLAAARRLQASTIRELARTRPLPGLVLLDMMMPVLDGLGFSQEMHAVPEWKDIPVVIFSASAGSETVAQVGARAYLRKPVDVSVLLDTIGQHVRAG